MKESDATFFNVKRIHDLLMWLGGNVTMEDIADALTDKQAIELLQKLEIVNNMAVDRRNQKTN